MRKTNKIQFTLLLLLLWGFMSPVAHSGSILQAQLEYLEKELETQRKLNHIPGLAIAVVKGNELVYAKGMGFQDLQEQQPASKDTLFPIGSVSKPITAMLAGIRVDDGVIGWNDKLVKYLPNYQFTHNGEIVPVTLRDALSHRSGYGRNDTLWANPQSSRLDILKAAPQATPVAEYGTEYHYNNIMYLAAGMATAHDKEFDWEGVLHDRLLTSLNMSSTTSDYAKVVNDPRMSKGYYWHNIHQRYAELPLRDLHNIAPAGGIYSNVQDMAQWLKLILNKGRAENKQLIKTETLLEITSPVNNISPTFDYGLGWNLTQYNGELLMEHAGSIEGYSAQVGLLPDSGLGFILLMNVSVSPLQPASINLVFDALTQKPTSEEAFSQPDYSQYEGDYLANFWQFQNVHFSFKVQGSKPALNIPGQTLYMLKAPNEEGKFYFELTDKVAVSFQLNDQDEVLNMVHHEEGQTFILPKKEPQNYQKTEVLSSQAVLDLYDSMNTREQKQVYEKLGKIEFKGRVHQIQSGVKGQFQLISDGLTWQLKQDFGELAYLETKADAKGGFNKRLRHQYQLTGYLHQQVLREHPFHFLYWDQIYQGISVEESITVPHGDKDKPAGTKLHTVTLESETLPGATAMVDTVTGRINNLSMPFIDPVWGQYSREVRYLDYSPFCGLDIPRRFEIEDHETGKSIFTITEISAENCTNQSSN